MMRAATQKGTPSHLRRLIMLAVLAGSLVWLLAACGAAGSGPINDIPSLADHLRTAGANVEVTGTIKHPFLAVPGQILTVNDSVIEAFKYDNAKALAADTANIDPDGCIGTLGGGMLDPWTAPPHFFKSENVMVIYLGSDSKMLQLLTKVLGKQFAGE